MRDRILIGVLIVMGVLAVSLVGYYQSELTGALRMQVWDKSGPAKAVEEFARAVREGDLEAVQRVAPGAVTETADGRIMAVRPPAASPQMTPLPVERILPAGSADGFQVSYKLSMGLAKVQTTNEQGQAVTYSLRRGTSWTIESFAME